MVSSSVETIRKGIWLNSVREERKAIFNQIQEQKIYMVLAMIWMKMSLIGWLFGHVVSSWWCGLAGNMGTVRDTALLEEPHHWGQTLGFIVLSLSLYLSPLLYPSFLPPSFLRWMYKHKCVQQLRTPATCYHAFLQLWSLYLRNCNPDEPSS